MLIKMGFYKYSAEFTPDKSAKAQAYDVNASYKDMTQVLRSMRGRSVAKAREVLAGVIEMRKAIPFAKFNKGMGHRSELGGHKGKYPRKESGLALKLLDNAVANAVTKGLDEKNLIVLYACAYKQNIFPRYRRFFVGSNTLGYGKQAIYSDYVTTRMEITVGVKDAKKFSGRKARLELSAAKAAAKKSEKTPAKQAPKEPIKTVKAQASTEKKESKEESPAAVKPAVHHEHIHHEGHVHAASDKKN